jgi:hypothetical protein
MTVNLPPVPVIVAAHTLEPKSRFIGWGYFWPSTKIKPGQAIEPQHRAAQLQLRRPMTEV